MKIAVYLYKDGLAIHYFDGRKPFESVHTVKKIMFPEFMRKEIVQMILEKYTGVNADLDIIDSTILRLKEDTLP